jgi:hypothetical protein
MSGGRTCQQGDDPMLRPISETKTIDITGYLIPWTEDGSPLVFHVDGLDDLFIPIFSSEEKLLRVMITTTVTESEDHPMILSILADIPFESIKQIDYGYEFLQSIKEAEELNKVRVRVAADLYVTDRGTLSFTEVSKTKLS